MAKRFKQFLLENEIRYNDITNDSTIRNVLDKLPNNDSTRMIIAKFVLYCVEDVFEFNNDETRNAAKHCIDLIRKYINNPQSVTAQELNTSYTFAVAVADVASDAASDAAYYAASATYYAIFAIASIKDDPSAIYYAVNTADYSTYAYNYDYEDNFGNIREQKLNEYKQYLNMLTAKYHHSDENTSHKINQLTQNKPETEQQWFSFLTQIIDELEVKNIIRQLPNGSSELHLPFANIHANSQLELIDIISRNERIRDLIYSWFV